MFSGIMFIGWIGLLCIAVAWIPQTYTVLKTKHSTMPVSFTLLYIVGSTALLVYSILLQDLVFIILNTLATLSACIHLFVSMRIKQ